MNFQVPQEWYCPITQELMKNPTIAEDGMTYERSAILDWLKHSSKSPLTNITITVQGLKTNYALKHTIEGYLNGSFKLVNQNVQVEKIEEDKEDAKNPVGSINSITFEQKLYNFQNKNYLHLKMLTQKQGKVVPTFFICLIDVSGSMANETTITEDQLESHGFSRLDLVKHSLRTIIESLHEQHYLSLISFSDNAKVVLDPTQLTKLGKQIAIQQVAALEPQNQTNIWDALRLGIEMTKHPYCNCENISILLLTDGVPNINPPRGIVQTLQKALEANPIKGNINTFGFGYELDSHLLNQIANLGSGQFAFIPDASMVGTIFINFISNQLATYLITQQVKVESTDNENGKFQAVEKIGSIFYDQSKDFFYEVTNKKFNVTFAGKTIEIPELQVLQPTDDFYYFYLRSQMIEIIKSCLEIENKSTQNNMLKKQEYVEAKFSQLKQINESEKYKFLLDDLNSPDPNLGQVFKAISRQDWYEKWGRHYLKSLLHAHQQQMSNTFKENGVQLYAGSVFTKFRDLIDELFCKLPPPKPSVKKQVIQQVQDMSYYYNYGGGCFDGNGRVKMENSSFKLVKNLQKGDKVFGGYEIQCLIKMEVKKVMELVNLNGMLITPWHPVLHQSKWEFPIKIKEAENIYIDDIYNISFVSGHVAIINGILVCGVGHNLKDNNVIAHEYFGTDKIIQDLKKVKGWNNGQIYLQDYKFQVSQKTGKINRLFINQ